MEQQESLESGTLIGQFADPIQDQINDFLSDGVMTPGIVVGCIFLACDELLGMEKLSGKRLEKNYL